MVICDLNTGYNQKRLKKVYDNIITNDTLTMKNDYDFFFFNSIGIILYGMGNTILL